MKAQIINLEDGYFLVRVSSNIFSFVFGIKNAIEKKKYFEEVLNGCNV